MRALSWALALVIALNIFLLFNLSASAVSLLVMIALLIYILERLRTTRHQGEG